MVVLTARTRGPVASPGGLRDRARPTKPNPDGDGGAASPSAAPLFAFPDRPAPAPRPITTARPAQVPVG
jgi:hypothetical protein